MRALALLILFTSCTTEMHTRGAFTPQEFPHAVPPPPVDLGTHACYLAKTLPEFTRLAKLAKKKKKITVEGKTYPCVEDASPTELECYLAKTKKEFAKLSKLQDSHPEKPLVIHGKRYRCIQESI